MRRCFTYLAFILCLLFSVSCKSSPTPPDSDFLGDFDPINLDKSVYNSIQEKNGDLKPLEAYFVFYPRANAVEMGFRFQMNTLRINLIGDTRKIMVESMNRYIEEYKSGKLTQENSKKKGYFGKSQTMIAWGLLAPDYFAQPTLRFEYQIASDGRPYFLIANASTEETTKDGYKIKNGANSPALRIAFSPIQCQNIITFLNQEYLDGIVNELTEEAQAFDIPKDDTTLSPQMF